MSVPSPFTRTDAVDTWDAEFRWREGDHLRDLTIDDSWWRVADRAAAAETTLAPLWAHRFADAFGRWRMLPGEELLRGLGTERPMACPAAPAAVLNVLAFVQKTPLGGARFDRDGFEATAALAVRWLDDVATVLQAQHWPLPLRVGIVGLADALQALGLDYDGSAARQQATRVAQALAEGCLRGSVELAEERGGRADPAQCRARVEDLRRRGLPEALLDRFAAAGMRHATLTALDPHPLLARLANGVADGFAPAAAFGKVDVAPGQADAGAAVDAMRAAIQPWIDEPLATPGRSP